MEPSTSNLPPPLNLEIVDLRELSACVLREARRQDHGELRALANRAAESLCASDYTPRQIATVMAYGCGLDEQLVADRTCYVIEKANRIIGVGAWSFRVGLMSDLAPDLERDPSGLLDPAMEPARLRMFFTHPEFSRRGIGRALVANCERKAADAGFTRLEMMSTLTGRRLFLACGFEDVEPATNIFPNGIAAGGFRMSKTISRADSASGRVASQHHSNRFSK